jgi:ATP-dependent DNA helicase RecQ
LAPVRRCCGSATAAGASPGRGLACGAVVGTDFTEAARALLGALEQERRSGVHDPALTGRLAETRAAWSALGADGRAAARSLAQELGRAVQARPAAGVAPAPRPTAVAEGAPTLEDELSAAQAGAAGPTLEDELAAAQAAYGDAAGPTLEDELAAAQVLRRDPTLLTLDDEAAARAAVQGLADLPAAGVTAARRVYDGPLEADALLAYFGLPGFRPGQREAVEAALVGRDALVVMPTGGGKSLTYQLPGIATADLTIVVSPLIALIADQFRRLATDGHPVAMLASGLGEEATRAALDSVRDGAARIVLCSPERFGSQAFLRALQSRRVDLFVVDEAHCISEWGHDFRPDYLRLPRVVEQLGRPAVMACTATATPEVAEEIKSRLGMRDPVEVRSGFDRPNLSFDVAVYEGQGSVAARLSVLQQLIADPANRPAIVYCGTRKDTEELTEAFLASGVDAAAYHAGLPADERASTQERFTGGDLDVVCATNAFGMGIDRSGIRCVAHYGMPGSLEAYYQEAGRAGRDGEPARAVLFAGKADLARQRRFIDDRVVAPERVGAFFARLGRAADGAGRVELQAGLRDDDRIALGIVERAGGATLEPGGGGRMLVTLAPGGLDGAAVRGLCAAAKERAWDGYHAIKDYAFGETCRRERLLRHFGDPGPGKPTGRCCDVCDPVTGLPTPVAARRSRSGSGSGAAAAPPVEGVDPVLFDALVAWRREASAGKPAYTVATNATLQLVAARKPATPDALLALRGVGPAFIDKFGADVLALVDQHR